MQMTKIFLEKKRKTGKLVSSHRENRLIIKINTYYILWLGILV